jgi:hypothetical protein
MRCQNGVIVADTVRVASGASGHLPLRMTQTVIVLAAATTTGDRQLWRH